ncbi:hypothetical protein PZA22_15705 [Pectobacterium polaris]|uniref:hypothetical protein n=1 Tax=Pectobacterium polaris TaxID=2042057 RepID=UPI0023B0DF52|nr:hypothetical protein [Pectobacterium polaris]MDE8755929.1 hypothetical protein [Pectobacterium polaris]
MSVKNMSRLEQYRASQAERIAAICRAIDEGKTTIVPSVAHDEKKPHDIRFFTLTPYSSKLVFGLYGVGRRQRF